MPSGLNKKGSLWSKWDFHVHTPASVLATGYGTDWDLYVKKLVEAAHREGISAIGVTDYFSIEGYKKLKTEYFQNAEKLKELFSDNKELLDKARSLYLFPNIEFRLSTFVGDHSINYHVVFSDQVSVADIEEHFLGELDFAFIARPQDTTLKMKVKRANLEELGRRVKADQPDMQGTDYSVGLKSAVVGVDDIKAVLKRNPTRFDGKYLLGLPSDEDLSSIAWNGRDGDVRRQLIAGVDFLFASNANTREWALGKKAETKQQFIKEFQSLKPCIWGSDSHNFENFLRPARDRFCWVKCDLNFQGLRQIKYEPEGRVSIAAARPDEKNAYYTIDKIRFRDGPTSTFSPDWIELNPNLTTIIGGKSAGKSLLLYYLAKTINPAEADKLKTSNGKAPYECEAVDNFDFEVLWSDGEVNKLRQPISERKKKITYLPQLYINSLVEGKSRKELDRLIEDVLLENDAYAGERDRFDSACNTIDSSIESSVGLLLTTIDQRQKALEALGKLGDKTAHLKQVEALREKITALAKDSTLTEAEKEELTKYRDEHKVESEELKRIENDFDHYSTFVTAFDEEAEDDAVSSVMDAYYDSDLSLATPSEKVAKFIESITHLLKSEFSKTVEKARLAAEVEQNTLAQQKEACAKRVAQLLELLRPFAGKFKNRDELLKHEEQLKAQLLVVSQIEAGEKKISGLDQEIAELKIRIWESRAKYRETYQSFVDFIKSIGFDKIAGDIDLLVEMKFDEEDFHEAVINGLNLLSIKKLFPEEYDESRQRLTKVTIETFKKLLEAILVGDVKMKASVKKDDLLRRLLRNFLSLGFNLKHKGDDLFKMSPGKRGIVVLKVLLHLSNSKDPILIDQPEDNLDNRTIYEELNSFIQDKKKVRQIVMVTHNANLVVATDAEAVIVCNQGGQTPGRENRTYVFEYNSGALENSFLDAAQPGVLFQKGVREHVCEVLEGGQEAFRNRQAKYEFAS